MTLAFRPVNSAVAGFLTVAVAGLVAVHMNGFWPDQGLDEAPASGAAQLISKAVDVAAPPVATVAARAMSGNTNASYYNTLRTQMRWVETRMGTAMLKTPDEASRLLLVKAAADRARLADVGLSYRDVYGIISAETSWTPRSGMGKNGTPSLGIAQFEPATAKALGLANPNDPVEAVHVAALHMKEAALWSADRLAGLKLSVADRAEKLREGVSIYYNLSTRGRNTWNGRNTAKLPRETQRHIANSRDGAQQAAWLDAQLEGQKYSSTQGRAMTVADASFRR
ncbi:MAG: hypothetical protein H7255_09595 [Ramlibacter sp.]|nr:hypothetical protein [Ramlibacter sp.]